MTRTTENMSARLRCFYRKGTYAISINPDDQHQFFGQPDRLKKFRDKMYENMLSIFSCNKIPYELYIELSEVRNIKNSGPRLHLHGVVSFRSEDALRDFLLTGYYQFTRFATIDIDTISDLPYWHKYCMKQQWLINEEPLTSHSTSLFKILLDKYDKVPKYLPSYDTN